MPNQIIITPAVLQSLKEKYNEAVSKKQESFMFEGHEMLVSYTKYLIEHCENTFRNAQYHASPETLRKNLGLDKRQPYSLEDVEQRRAAISGAMDKHPSQDICATKLRPLGYVRLGSYMGELTIYALQLEAAARELMPDYDLSNIDKEVYAEFGKWWVTQVVHYCEPAKLPTREACCTELRVTMATFFCMKQNCNVTEEKLIQAFHKIDLPNVE